jgi:hypothetical protein
MSNETLTLQFVRDCPTINQKARDTITMSLQEYKGLAEKTHPKNKYKAGPNKGKRVFLDPRLNHTVVIDGEWLLEDGPNPPAKMSLEECQAELKQKGITFEADAGVTALRKLVVFGRKQ